MPWINETVTAKLFRFGRDVVHAQNERDAEDDRQVDDYAMTVGDNGQLFHVVGARLNSPAPTHWLTTAAGPS